MDVKERKGKERKDGKVNGGNEREGKTEGWHGEKEWKKCRKDDMEERKRSKF